MNKGRPVKLAEAQVQEIQRRVAGGESVRSLAKEFKVSPALISAKCSPRAERLRNIAKAKVTVDRVFEQLPFSEQGTVLNLMDSMKSITAGLMRVADLNGKTAQIVAEKGHKKAQNLGPDPDIEALREIAAYAETTNKLGSLGVSMVQANKNLIPDMIPEPENLRNLSTAALLEMVDKIRGQLKGHDLGAKDPFMTVNCFSGIPRNVTKETQRNLPELSTEREPHDHT